MKKLLFLLLLCLPFCSWSQEVVFPDLPAWKSEGKPQVFNKDNLYEHIDGAAEFYLSYGFETLQVASWNYNGAELTIEVYDHADPLHAYGIYGIEKSANAETLPVGLEGYGDAATFNFVAGRYYVKMSAMQPEKVPDFSLKKSAEAFALSLCAKPEYPKLVGIFPKENSIPNSCQFIPSEFMGLGFLGSAIREKFKLSGEEITLFVIEKSDRSEVEQMVLKYISYTGVKAKKPAEGDLILKDPNNGTVFLRWKGNYLLGATGFTDQKTVVPLLDQIAKKL